MITIPATEFSKNFGQYREAAQRGPVAVTSHERITGYFVSRADYEEYMRFKARMPKALAVSELSEETLRAIAGARMDKRHAHLDRLMDD